MPPMNGLRRANLRSLHVEAEVNKVMAGCNVVFYSV